MGRDALSELIIWGSNQDSYRSKGVIDNKQIEHIHGKHIGLVAYLSRHSVEIAPLLSELGYTFVVAQIDSMNKLLQPLASINTGKLNLNSDVMCKSKLQRELSHRRECAAKKRFSTDRIVLALSLHQIFRSNHLRTESCFNCKIIIRLAISNLSKRLKNRRSDGQETQILSSINVQWTTSSTQPTADTSIIPLAMFPNSLFDWAEFLDAEFIATPTKADEILNCIVEALIAINYYQIKTLYHPFNQSLYQFR